MTTQQSVTDLDTILILTHMLEHHIDLAESCRRHDVQSLDFVMHLEDRGLLAEFCKRSSRQAIERLVEIARAAVGTAFADNPVGMLLAVKMLNDYEQGVVQSD